MGETRKLYLPEELNVTKMYHLFLESNPDAKVSYESYRTIFNTKYNIGFRYPRKDTCSTCDEFIVQQQHLDSRIQAENDQGVLLELNCQRVTLTDTHSLHKRKATTFYDRKYTDIHKAKATGDFEAACFDFAKNLPVPSKTTNDVYYRRQLNLYTFVVHILSTDQVFFYTYDETIGKKGADDVCSLLADFFSNHLPETVLELSLFCDGCSGQNKNYTMLRFLYNQVHDLKRFRKITIKFPIRGHSYMECDRDFANVNSTKDIDRPKDWHLEFTNARKKPMPLTVKTVSQDIFVAYTKFLLPSFKPTCPIKTRPVREIIFSESHAQLIIYRESWNGSFETAVIKRPTGRRIQSLAPVLEKSYNGLLPISAEKYKDLQVLKRFCSASSHSFFENLPHTGEKSQSTSADFSDESDIEN